MARRRIVWTIEESWRLKVERLMGEGVEGLKDGRERKVEKWREKNNLRMEREEGFKDEEKGIEERSKCERMKKEAWKDERE